MRCNISELAIPWKWTVVSTQFVSCLAVCGFNTLTVESAGDGSAFSARTYLRYSTLRFRHVPRRENNWTSTTSKIQVASLSSKDELHSLSFLSFEFQDTKNNSLDLRTFLSSPNMRLPCRHH